MPSVYLTSTEVRTLRDEIDDLRRTLADLKREARGKKTWERSARGLRRVDNIRRLLNGRRDRATPPVPPVVEKVLETFPGSRILKHGSKQD